MTRNVAFYEHRIWLNQMWGMRNVRRDRFTVM